MIAFELPVAPVIEISHEDASLLNHLRLMHDERQALYRTLDASRPPPQVTDADDHAGAWFAGLRNLFRRRAA